MQLIGDRFLPSFLPGQTDATIVSERTRHCPVKERVGFVSDADSNGLKTCKQDHFPSFEKIKRQINQRFSKWESFCFVTVNVFFLAILRIVYFNLIKCGTHPCGWGTKKHDCGRTVKRSRDWSQTISSVWPMIIKTEAKEQVDKNRRAKAWKIDAKHGKDQSTIVDTWRWFLTEQSFLANSYSWSPKLSWLSSSSQPSLFLDDDKRKCRGDDEIDVIRADIRIKEKDVNDDSVRGMQPDVTENRRSESNVTHTHTSSSVLRIWLEKEREREMCMMDESNRD